MAASADGVNFDAAAFGISAVFLFSLINGSGENELVAAGIECAGSPHLRVDRVQERAGSRVKKGGVPLPVKEAASHDERLCTGFEGKRFHQAASNFGFFGFADFLPVTP